MKKNNLIRALVMFLIRKKLKVEVGEYFMFANQKEDCVYKIEKYAVYKQYDPRINCFAFPSNISVNWLLNDECHIIKIEEA